MDSFSLTSLGSGVVAGHDEILSDESCFQKPLVRYARAVGRHTYTRIASTGQPRLSMLLSVEVICQPSGFIQHGELMFYRPKTKRCTDERQS
jgi:hypothetical protein